MARSTAKPAAAAPEPERKPLGPMDLERAQATIQALRDAGIDENDPDFGELVDNECDELKRMRSMIRAAKFYEARAAGTKAYADRIDAKAKAELARSVRLKELVFGLMNVLELTTLPGVPHTAYVRQGRNGVRISDEALIPNAYCKIERTPKKTEIKTALEAGADVPGASLGNAPPYLEVR